MTELFIGLIEWGVQFAALWGPVLILIFMTVESSFVPFPSEVVMIPAGVIVARHAEYWWVQSPAVGLTVAIGLGILGSLVGAWINYGLSMKLGRPFMYRHAKYFFLSEQKLARAEEIFREYGDIATFVCRLLPAIRQLISIPAGLSRMHFGRFSLFTGLGAGIWVVVLTMMGYWFGLKMGDKSYADLVHTSKELITSYLPHLLIGSALLIAGYVYVHKKIMHGKLPAHAEGENANAPLSETPDSPSEQ